MYNERDIVEQCLTSLYEQCQDIDEVIVVDNNSTDGSYELVRDAFPTFRLVREPRQGVVHARTTGMNLAKSDIIGRVDADVHIGKGWARALRQYFVDNPKISAMSGLVEYHDVPFPAIAREISKFAANKMNIISLGSLSLFGCNMALRRTSWQVICPHLLKAAGIMEDLDMSIHLKEKGLNIGFSPKVIVYGTVRRFRNSPLSFYQYMRLIPNTYVANRRYLSALAAWPGVIISCIFQVLLARPVVIRYDSTANKLRLRPYYRKNNNRVLP